MSIPTAIHTQMQNETSVFANVKSPLPEGKVEDGDLVNAYNVNVRTSGGEG